MEPRNRLWLVAVMAAVLVAIAGLAAIARLRSPDTGAVAAGGQSADGGTVRSTGTAVPAPADHQDEDQVPPGPDGCVAVPTTVPGMELCPGYDPSEEMSASAPPATVLCPATAIRPVERWLADNDSHDSRDLGLYRPVEMSPAPDLDRLVTPLLAALPAGFSVAERSATTDEACPGRSPILRAKLTGPDGATVTVTSVRLTQPIPWSVTPFSGERQHRDQPDGTEVVLNDFSGDGTILRVWAARPDGTMVSIRAAGHDTADQSGWPTTIPDTRPPGVVPGPAPLSLDDLETLALVLLD